MKFFLSWMLMAAVLGLAGCAENPKPEEPKPPVIPPVVKTLNISVEGLTFESAFVKVAPTDQQMFYYVSLIEKKEYDKISNDAKFVDLEVNFMKKVADANGVSFEEFLKLVLVAGDYTETYEAALDANTEFYAYAYGLSKTGEVLLPMEKIYFKTPEAPPVQIIDCEFEFQMQTLEDRKYAFVVYPSNLKVLVWIDTVLKTVYDRLGGTPEALGEHIGRLFAQEAAQAGETLGAYVRSSVRPGMQGFMEYMGALADTEYVAFAMGFDSQGRVCTHVAINVFRTLPLQISGAVVEVEFDKYYDGAALNVYDPARYAKFKEKAYLPCYLMPGSEAEEWAVMWVPNNLGEFPDDGLAPIIKDNGAKNKKGVAIGCKWGEGVVASVAWSSVGVFGEVKRYPVNLTKEGVSPIEEIVDPKRTPLYEVPMVLTAEAEKVYLAPSFTHLQKLKEQRQPVIGPRFRVQ